MLVVYYIRINSKTGLSVTKSRNCLRNGALYLDMHTGPYHHSPKDQK